MALAHLSRMIHHPAAVITKMSQMTHAKVLYYFYHKIAWSGFDTASATTPQKQIQGGYNMPKQYMLILDTDRIQDYIFATTKLKEIRGASALLDDLNLEEMPKILSKSSGKTISIGGGSARILFQENDKDKAANLLNEIESLYSMHTGNGATITGIVVEGEATESDRTLMERAEIALRLRKQNRSVCAQPLTNPHFKICDSSGSAPAVKKAGDVVPADDRLLSLATYKKLDYSTAARGYFGWFAEYAREHLPTNNLVQKYFAAPEKYVPESLAEIGELSTPSGYIGLIYADGNRMGWRLQEHFDSFEQIAEFSEKIKAATSKALFEALYKILQTDQPLFPFEILLVGGDDILLVVPAQHALDVALDFAKHFKGETGYNTKTNEATQVSLGVGIVIAHATHPIRHLISLAEELAGSAKVKSQEAFANSGQKEEKNYFNFLVNKGASIRSYDDIFDKELQYRDSARAAEATIKLHRRPYDDDGLKKVQDTIIELKAKNTPRTKLMQLYRALYSGWGQGTLDSLLIASRLPKDTRDFLLQKFAGSGQAFPWHYKAEANEYETPLLDWIELYDFIEAPANDKNQ